MLCCLVDTKIYLTSVLKCSSDELFFFRCIFKEAIYFEFEYESSVHAFVLKFLQLIAKKKKIKERCEEASHVLIWQLHQ